MTLRLFTHNPYSARMGCLHGFAVACGLLACFLCDRGDQILFFALSVAGIIAMSMLLAAASLRRGSGGRKLVVIAGLSFAWFGLSAACQIVGLNFQPLAFCGLFAGGSSAGYLMALPLWFAMAFSEEGES